MDKVIKRNKFGSVLIISVAMILLAQTYPELSNTYQSLMFLVGMSTLGLLIIGILLHETKL